MTFSPLACRTMEKEAHKTLTKALERQARSIQDKSITEKSIKIIYENASQYLEALAAAIHKEKIRRMMQ